MHGYTTQIVDFRICTKDRVLDISL